MRFRCTFLWSSLGGATGDGPEECLDGVRDLFASCSTLGPLPFSPTYNPGVGIRAAWAATICQLRIGSGIFIICELSIVLNKHEFTVLTPLPAIGISIQLHVFSCTNATGCMVFMHDRKSDCRIGQLAGRSHTAHCPRRRRPYSSQYSIGGHRRVGAG